MGKNEYTIEMLASTTYSKIPYRLNWKP